MVMHGKMLNTAGNGVEDYSDHPEKYSDLSLLFGKD